jgi:hypothetical protein
VELLKQLGTLVEMLNRFPTVVLGPVPFPLDQVPYLEVENMLHLTRLLSLLGRGSHS